MRGYFYAGRAYTPIRRVEFSTDGKEWNLPNVKINAAPDEQRLIVIFAAGPGALALIEHYLKARRKLGSGGVKLPEIQNVPPDLVKCAEVWVVRKRLRELPKCRRLTSPSNREPTAFRRCLRLMSNVGRQKSGLGEEAGTEDVEIVDYD